MKKIIIPLVLLLFVFGGCSNQSENTESGEISIIPAPESVEVFPGFYQISANTIILGPENADDNGVVEYFIQFFYQASGIMLKMDNDHESQGVISLNYISDDELGDEGYRLEVDKHGVKISANTSAGLFYGIQSLLQLLPVEAYANEVSENIQWEIPFCKVFDKPRFGWRGMHLDVSRHFFTVDFIKRFIDLIAMHKMNVFHWHLTDDNGWRIEIKKYPKLTEVAAWRVNREDMPWREVTPPKQGEESTYGGYYTQAEVSEVLRYAAERHITVIPEIEMPGHTSEVFAAYPELSCTGEQLFVQPGVYWPNTDIFCAGKEETFVFIEDVLSEVIDLFPAPYLHIGGDEATKTHWESCKNCQQRIKDEGLSGEDELQSWFIRRVEAFLISKGKKMIGWDEILEGGLAPEATVMSWRGTKGGIEAAELGHDVIMCPTSHCYFDYYQANPDFEPEAIGGFTSLKKVYGFEPIPEGLDSQKARYILGAQGNVWTEYIATSEHAEYMSVPRMCALAEVVWSQRKSRDWHNFQKRLQDQFKRFDVMGVNYSKGSWKVDIQPISKNGTYTIELTSEQYNMPIHYTLDGTVPTTASQVYQEPITLTESTQIQAALFENDELKEYASVKEIVFHQGIGKNVTINHLPSKGYYAKGTLSLVDGLKGSDNFRDGYWLGFEGIDLDLLIDLEKDTPIRSVSSDFFQNSGAWIFLPEEVIISLFDSNHDSIVSSILVPESTMEVRGSIIEELKAEFENVSARYVGMRARGLKIIPDWHEGAGNKGWLFVDEMIIN